MAVKAEKPHNTSERKGMKQACFSGAFRQMAGNCRSSPKLATANFPINATRMQKNSAYGNMQHKENHTFLSRITRNYSTIDFRVHFHIYTGVILLLRSHSRYHENNTHHPKEIEYVTGQADRGRRRIA